MVNFDSYLHSNAAQYLDESQVLGHSLVQFSGDDLEID